MTLCIADTHKGVWQTSMMELFTKIICGLKNCALQINLTNCTNLTLHITLIYTTQKLKFSFKDFLSKCDQIRRKLRIWSHLLRKSLMENFIFHAVTFTVNSRYLEYSTSWTYRYLEEIPCSLGHLALFSVKIISLSWMSMRYLQHLVFSNHLPDRVPWPSFSCYLKLFLKFTTF